MTKKLLNIIDKKVLIGKENQQTMIQYITEHAGVTDYTVEETKDTIKIWQIKNTNN